MIPKRNKTNDDNVNYDSVFSPAEMYGIEFTLQGIDSKEIDKFLNILSRMEEAVKEDGEPKTNS